MARFKLVPSKFILAAMFCLAACNDSGTEQTWQKVQQGLDTVNKHIAPVADSVTSMTSEQLGDVMKFEYRVVRFPANATPAHIEANLNELGKERWECFGASPTADGTMMYCKRIPYAMIRYLLRAM